MDHSKRKITSLQKEATHFTIKDTFNQNSGKECGPHNVWVFKQHHIPPVHYTQRTLFLKEDIWENLADFLEKSYG